MAFPGSQVIAGAGSASLTWINSRFGLEAIVDMLISASGSENEKDGFGDRMDGYFWFASTLQ